VREETTMSIPVLVGLDVPNMWAYVSGAMVTAAAAAALIAGLERVDPRASRRPEEAAQAGDPGRERRAA
jgi:hypothetical protein